MRSDAPNERSRLSPQLIWATPQPEMFEKIPVPEGAMLMEPRLKLDGVAALMVMPARTGGMRGGFAAKVRGEVREVVFMDGLLMTG